MLVRFLLLPFLLLSQEPRFSSDVKVVNILATVHDKKGQISSNLTKDDFAIEEEGRPQVIQYFSRETNLPLTIGLLVDTSMSQQRVIGDEQRAAYKFLDQVLSQKDQAFVIHFDHDVELLQDLTNSHPKLEKSLGELETPRQLRRGTPGASPTRGGGRRGGGGTALYDSVLLASNEVLRDQAGRKAVIILSDGVDNGSKVSLTDAIEAAQRNEVLVYGILFSDEQAYGGGGLGMPNRRGGRGGGGRRPDVMPRSDDGKKVLQRLAVETGGGFFEVSKKQPLDESFARIQDELRNQYSMGFVPDRPGAAGAFRRLEVSVPKQKNLAVQARSGYFAK